MIKSTIHHCTQVTDHVGGAMTSNGGSWEERERRGWGFWRIYVENEVNEVMTCYERGN